MKVEYVNPFIEAAKSVMQTLLKITPERGALSVRPKVTTTQQVNIVCGIAGQIEGRVIYGMSVTAADKIASQC